MKTAAALILAASFAGTTLANEPAAPAPDPAKGAVASAACQACHTADGSRGLPANPILQGQHPEYIVKQLTEFKAGKRKNAVMTGMAATVPDDQIANIAAFYAGKKPVPGAARNKDTLALGERIYRAGIAGKQVPACAGCHSPNGAGIPAQYPRIGGQNPDYVESQLVNFRSGERSNSPQMMAIAGRLSDKEMKAVADYIAGLH